MKKIKKNSQRQAKRKYLKNYVHTKKDIFPLWLQSLRFLCKCMRINLCVPATSFPSTVCVISVHDSPIQSCIKKNVVKECMFACVWCNETKRRKKKNILNGSIIFKCIFSYKYVCHQLKINNNFQYVLMRGLDRVNTNTRLYD